MSDATRIKITCADGHKRLVAYNGVKLGGADWSFDLSYAVESARAAGDEAAGKVRIACPRCRRTMVLSHDRYIQVMDKLAAAGITTVELRQLERAVLT